MTDAVALNDVSVAFRPEWPRRGPPVHALRDVTLSVPRGCALGLVGESGSGKSTLGRVLLRLIKPEQGGVRINGADPYALEGADLASYRRTVQAVFQDSEASLNPRMKIGAAVREGLDIHGIGSHDQRVGRAMDLLTQVGLDADFADRYPHTLSGGQRQRVNIARALALEPSILIADEPISALDVAIQAQILDLFADLHRRRNLTLIFISHDLEVVRGLCDRIAVLQHGRIVETGLVSDVMRQPREDYTKTLLAAVPMLPCRRSQKNDGPLGQRLVSIG